jgi:type IV secretory pathway protease TraF
MARQSISQQSDRQRIFRKLNSREKGIALIFLAALLAGLWIPARITVSTSASLGHRIFFLTSHTREQIEDGDYLVFRHGRTPFIRPGLHSHDQLYIKQVGCSPGEFLRRDEHGHFFCQQTLLGEALTWDSKGNELPQFTYHGTVPDNCFFMVGSHPRSFDSKYFGFIHADEIIHKALPLW